MGDGATIVDGNALALLPDGPERLDALLAVIHGARRSLQLLFYIYTDGDAGRAIGEALVAAHRRGVQVSLIVDGMGSEPAEASGFFERLVASGLDVCRFVPKIGRKYLLRNHQKLAIADGEVAIIGGFNVGDDYFGRVEDRAWRDLGLRVEGPVVEHLSGYAHALQAWTRRERAPIRALNRALTRWSQPEGHLRWLFGGPTRRLSPWAQAVRQDLHRGRRADLVAGYFAPNPQMLRRLDRAAQRGRLRLVLPARTDHQIAVSASRFTYSGLLKKGAEIYEYQPTKLHTKLVLIDDAVYIGSANFDIRSLFLNLEIMLRIEDAGFAALVRAYVDGEVANSERITVELHRKRTRWWTRVVQFGAYFVMAVADLKLTKRLTGT